MAAEHREIQLISACWYNVCYSIFEIISVTLTNGITDNPLPKISTLNQIFLVCPDKVLATLIFSEIFIPKEIYSKGNTFHA